MSFDNNSIRKFMQFFLRLKHDMRKTSQSQSHNVGGFIYEGYRISICKHILHKIIFFHLMKLLIERKAICGKKFGFLNDKFNLVSMLY